jgi:hypothetical protein
MRNVFVVSSLSLASLVSLLALVACGGSDTRSGFDEQPAGSSGGFGSGDGGTGSLGSSSGSTPASGEGCSEEAKLVYVVSAQYDLYKFEPDKLAFTKLGRLSCPSNGATPNSMAIDRSGTAWVNYSDGGLFKVSTKDASCSATTFQKGQNGIVKFGMAFASNAVGSQDETLFVSGIEDGAILGGLGKGLASIDLGTMKLTRIADYDGNLTGQGAELTGTGDGRLYGFFTTFPDATLAKIEKASAKTSEAKALAGVSTGQAWAFSFWGGDFWFYTSNGFEPSKVTRLSTKDGNIAVVKPDVGGFRIVGAGVSTCAPLTSGPR